MKRPIQVSAPGSLMLLGEHAVLHGRLAIAAAVNRRLRVTLMPRTGRTVRVDSELGAWETDVEALDPPPPFRFVAAALRSGAPLPGGFALHIRADFPSTVGLGSSAAVTAATIGALRLFAGQPADPDPVFQATRAAIRAVQGAGSGADAAASVYGGVLVYRVEPPLLERLPARFPLALVYCGSKTPTPEVIRRVEALRQAEPVLFERLFDLSDACVRRAAEAIQQGDLPGLGRALNVAEGLMEAYGVVHGPLADLVLALRARPGIHGAKVSGSGLGDCAVAAGDPGDAPLPGERLPVELSATGLAVEDLPGDGSPAS